ncbi:MAG: hypothetical protein KKE12_01860 [Proteobacteria bacterium]|nr:hypothetical protein [Pseudomonadota bacterium]
MDFNAMDTAPPVTETITRRFSCRTYNDKPIPDEKRIMLEEFISEEKMGCGRTGNKKFTTTDKIPCNVVGDNQLKKSCDI